MAASPIGSGGSAGGWLESGSKRVVDCVSRGVSADDALKLVAPGLKPDARFACRGIRKKRLTPKKTEMIQPAVSPIDIR